MLRRAGWSVADLLEATARRALDPGDEQVQFPLPGISY